MSRDKPIDISAPTEPDEDWLDEVLDQSFPASDPVPLGHKEPDLKAVLARESHTRGN